MSKYILTLAFLLVFLCGCAAIPKYYETGKAGYVSPEGVAVREATEVAAGQFLPDPWPEILSSIAGLLAGGYAVHKRRQYLNEPPPESSS